MSDHKIVVTVNGRRHEAWVEARTLLVTFLREKLDLTGTHVGCVIGECGACSVLVDGELWRARMADGSPLVPGETVTVERVEENLELVVGSPHPTERD